MNLKTYLYKEIFENLEFISLIIDKKGNVIATNARWKKEAFKNKLAGRVDSIGTNYLELCERTEGEEKKDALAIAEGIKKVLKGKVSSFQKLYTFYDNEGQKRHFIFFIQKITRFKPELFLIMHIEVNWLSPPKGNISSRSSPSHIKRVHSEENFSYKELQILKLVKSGYTSKEISQILNLSKDTVDFYRKQIRKKLGLKGKGVSLKRFLQEKY